MALHSYNNGGISNYTYLLLYKVAVQYQYKNLPCYFICIGLKERKKNGPVSKFHNFLR